MVCVLVGTIGRSMELPKDLLFKHTEITFWCLSEKCEQGSLEEDLG